LAKSKVIKFRYFGGVVIGRIDSLILLGKYLDKINERFNLNCRLEIYTFSLTDDTSERISEIKSIAICDPLIGNELKEKISQSDFLVHAESFDAKYKNITKFSVSTKITEYLTYKRCIVAIGPDDVASIEIFKNNDIGICLYEEDDDKNVEVILNHIRTKELYIKKVLNGSKYYLEHFDKKKMIRNLLDNVS